MSLARDNSEPPRAIIHKRILDIAESRPDASMAEIADEIAGASTDLVETVLDEYGDPGDGPVEHPEDPVEDTASITSGEPTDDSGQQTEASGQDPEPTPRGASMEDADEAVDEPELTENQEETLRLICDRPNASQSELAAEFDVTAATISRWVNDIPGFEWNRRQDIAATLLNGTMPASAPDIESASEDQLDDRLAALEERLEAVESRGNGLDPELVHKVMHACLHSDRITEDEELQLLKTFMGLDDRS